MKKTESRVTSFIKQVRLADENTFSRQQIVITEVNLQSWLYVAVKKCQLCVKCLLLWALNDQMTQVPQE